MELQSHEACLPATSVFLAAPVTRLVTALPQENHHRFQAVVSAISFANLFDFEVLQSPITEVP